MIVILGVIIINIFMSNPLQLPKEIIRANILRVTPIGTNIDDIIKIINDKKEWNDYRIVNEKTIRVLMKQYATVFILPLTTHTHVYWEFDVDSNLINVKVIKSLDMP